MQHAKDYGLSAEKVGFDAAAVVKRSRGVSGQLNGGVGFLLKKNKVDVIWGEATITKPGEVKVGKPSRSRGAAAPRSKGTAGEGTYKAKTHHRLDRRAPARAARASSRTANHLDLFRGHGAAKCPNRCWSMGSGAIGIEFASFYRTMGAEVTVVELVPQILPVEDAEIAALAQKRFEKQGMKILTGAKVSGSNKTGAMRDRDHRDKGRQEDRDAQGGKLISAVGVVGNIESSGLKRWA
jgi:dihydrolipoamide dehydrogenase